MSEWLGGSGESIRDLGEDLLEGAGGPAEGMSERVPRGDELEDSLLEGSRVRYSTWRLRRVGTP